MLAGAFIALILCGGPTATPEARLHQAIKNYQEFETNKARAELTLLTAPTNPRAVRANAHLYLGLISFNMGDTDGALDQFAAALSDNPALEVPPHSSPKVQLAMEQARQALLRRPGRSDAPLTLTATAPQAAPAPPLQLTVEEPTAPTAKRDLHLPAWILGGAGVIATGVAIYGGVQVVDYYSLVSNANAKVGNQAAPAYYASRSNAQTWEVGWIVAAAVGAACFGGAALTW